MNQKPAAGFTLVELMIAITLGLLLSLGIIRVFLGTLETRQLNQNLSETQENARVALDFLTADIRLAGYQHPAAIGERIPQFFTGGCGETASACTANGDTVPDQIAVVFSPPDTTDGRVPAACNGSLLSEDNLGGEVNEAVVISHYFIRKDANTGMDTLYCQSYRVNDVTRDPFTLTAMGRPQPLVPGIAQMQFLYLAGSRYVSADRLTPDQWYSDSENPVSAVRIALLAGSSPAGAYGPGTAREYQLLDSQPVTYHDRINRHVYTTTVSLNN